jgi:hypothetical protein
MITLNITPEADWSISCGDDYCDGYGCDIHSAYQGEACEVIGCTSPVSSYLVEVEGMAMDMCHYHYNVG